MDNVKRASSPENQCLQVLPTGQCPNEKVVDSRFCPVHDSLSKHHREARNVHSLRLLKFQARVNEHSESGAIKSLRGEIGVLRMLLEGVINKCSDEAELLLSSGRISDLVLKLEKLVVSCHKIEQGSAGTMDRAALLQFASQVVTIIGNHVSDEKVIDAISTDILKELGDARL
jgi:hypothetical protein